MFISNVPRDELESLFKELLNQLDEKEKVISQLEKDRANLVKESIEKDRRNQELRDDNLRLHEQLDKAYDLLANRS